MGKNRKGSRSRALNAEQRERDAGYEVLDAALGALWQVIASGDTLGAEMQVSEFLGLPGLADGDDEAITEIVGGLLARAEDALEPADQAAFLRLLLALGERPVKRLASAELAELTGDGVYPPDWVTGIGKPVPGHALRAQDAFGEQEFIVVTFSYGDREHAIVVGLDLAELPTITLTGLSTDPAKAHKIVEDDPTFGGTLTDMPLAEARRRIEGPLAAYGTDPDYDFDPDSALALPLIRSRVRRLPVPEPGTAATYTADDRSAAVAEFLASPLAAEAGAPDVARFWAQVLTGYSSRVRHEPPATVGKGRLSAALLLYVPEIFDLEPAHRDGMRQAVAAWTRWAAARQGIDPEAADSVVSYLDDELNDFAEVYDAPDSAARRAYVRDLVAADIDYAWLADAAARRALAVPLPDDRDPDDADLDATDPAGRATLTEHQFAPCAPDGRDGVEFMAAAKRVVEALWQDDPADLWRAAKALLASGHEPHEVIHILTKLPTS